MCVLADSVVQDKDISLPTIISLAEYLPNSTKDAPNGSNEFGFELRRRIREWTPIVTGSFGIPLRRLIRGPNVEDRDAIDTLLFMLVMKVLWLLMRKQWRTIFVRIAFWWLSLAIPRQMFILLQKNAETLSKLEEKTMP